MLAKQILFNTRMVKAIIGGFKTQTRRLIKNLPLVEPYASIEDGELLICDDNGDWYPAKLFSRIQVDDILWVRETWQKDVGRYMYRANYSDSEKFYMNGHEIRMTWRPSIHMPREAARLFLRVKDVRVERLQSISEDDAMAEGAIGGEYLDEQGNSMGIVYPHEDFARIWDSTIKPAELIQAGWDANPWVYVYEFERCPKPDEW